MHIHTAFKWPENTYKKKGVRAVNDAYALHAFHRLRLSALDYLNGLLRPVLCVSQYINA